MKCSEVQNLMIESLEGKLQPEEEMKVKSHFRGCKKCEAEWMQLHEMTAELASRSKEIEIPDGFMLNVAGRVRKTILNRKKRKISGIGGLAAAVCLTLFVGTAAANGGFGSFKDWWQAFSEEESEQEQQYIQSGIGEKLSLEDESSGVKVRITSVAADDIQTLIYYEIEDAEDEDQYMIDFSGLEVLNPAQYWENQSDSPIRSQMNLDLSEEGKLKGKLAAAPMTADSGTIELRIRQLKKKDTAASEEQSEGSLPGILKGEWSFEIPVKKHPAIEYPLTVQTETDGNPIIFEKLVIAPTATMLTYSYQDTHTDKSLDHIAIESIETENGLVYNQLFGPGSGSSSGGWNTITASFNSLYEEKPKKITIHLGAMQYSAEEPKTVELKGKELPIEFEYKGNRLSIDKIEFGKTAKVVLTEELPNNRAYEKLHYSISAQGKTSSAANSDGFFIDKYGQRYNASEYMMRTAELKEPRLYTTKHTINLFGDGSKDVIPARLQIEGFSFTKFSNKKMKIELDGKAGH